MLGMLCTGSGATSATGSGAALTSAATSAAGPACPLTSAGAPASLVLTSAGALEAFLAGAFPGLEGFSACWTWRSSAALERSKSSASERWGESSVLAAERKGVVEQHANACAVYFLDRARIGLTRAGDLKQQETPLEVLFVLQCCRIEVKKNLAKLLPMWCSVSSCEERSAKVVPWFKACLTEIRVDVELREDWKLARRDI